MKTKEAVAQRKSATAPRFVLFIHVSDLVFAGETSFLQILIDDVAIEGPRNVLLRSLI